MGSSSNGAPDRAGCATCGGSLGGKQGTAKYCSSSCRFKAPSVKAKIKEWRQANPANPQRAAIKYAHTANGHIGRTYNQAKRRVEGKTDRAHLYEGLPIMTRKEFVAWAWNDSAFWRQYKAWVQFGFPVNLAPSINRINPERGYVPGNVEWVTQSVNSSLARRPGREAITQAIKRAMNVA